MPTTGVRDPQTTPQDATQAASSTPGLPLSQEALECFPVPMSLYTADGLYVAANERIEHLFGLTRSSVLGKRNFLLDPDGQNEQQIKFFKSAVAGQSVQSPPIYYEVAFPGALNTDAASCWIEATYIPFHKANGPVTHIGVMYHDVTTRVQSEQKATLLERLIENASEGVASADMGGQITYGNPVFRTITGFGDQLLKATIADLDAESAAGPIIGQLMQQGSWRGQLVVRRADRSTFTSDASGFLLRDSAGQPSGLGLMVRDITDQQLRARQLRMFETLVENAPDAIGVWNMDGKLVYANRALGKLHGYTKESRDIDWHTMYHEQALPDLEAAWQEVHAKGSWQGVSQQVDQHGREFPVQLSFFLLYDEHKTPNGFAMIMRDIHEQQAHEQRLRVREALVENAAIGMGLADLQGNYIYANASLKEMLGYDDSIVGLPIMATINPADLQGFVDGFSALFAGQQVRTESRFLRKDGNIRIGSVLAMLIRDANGTPMATAAIIRDLTDERAREDERIELQQQVIAAQQAVLRELSTPLIPIADGVVAMPLIGTIDSARSQLIIETLLNGVAELRTNTAIIDITGVSVVDTQVANSLLRAAQAIKLLGAEVILTGIRPEVAQTLVGLGVDMSGIITRGSLQSGIAYALK